MKNTGLYHFICTTNILIVTRHTVSTWNPVFTYNNIIAIIFVSSQTWHKLRLALTVQIHGHTGELMMTGIGSNPPWCITGITLEGEWTSRKTKTFHPLSVFFFFWWVISEGMIRSPVFCTCSQCNLPIYRSTPCKGISQTWNLQLLVSKSFFSPELRPIGPRLFVCILH